MRQVIFGWFLSSLRTKRIAQGSLKLHSRLLVRLRSTTSTRNSCSHGGPTLAQIPNTFAEIVAQKHHHSQLERCCWCFLPARPQIFLCNVTLTCSTKRFNIKQSTRQTTSREGERIGQAHETMNTSSKRRKAVIKSCYHLEISTGANFTGHFSPQFFSINASLKVFPRVKPCNPKSVLQWVILALCSCDKKLALGLAV